MDQMTRSRNTAAQALGIRARRIAGFATAALLGLGFVGLSTLMGCQAPNGATPFAYGSLPTSAEALEADDTPISLEASLQPLRQAFDKESEVPRVVALMPHMGCERGAEILRREVLSAHPDRDLALFVIWQDEARTGGAAAAARATGYLADPRVTAFHDCSGIAGRAFARGNLPVAEAREIFLFYPAGMTWPSDGTRPMTAKPVSAERPPQTDKWVHQLGRVAPERFCTPEELPRAIRQTVKRLLDDADLRRKHLEEEAAEAVSSDPSSEPSRDPSRGPRTAMAAQEAVQ